jgi:uncharacterized damage-inducible protein DinB
MDHEQTPAKAQPALSALYPGWQNYQSLLIKALEPLSPDQLNLKAAPNLRSIEEIATHMIGARARWFYKLMGEGGAEFAALGGWDGKDGPVRSASEIADGLVMTWKGMQAAIARWSPEQWGQTYPGEDSSEPEAITRPWVIWHLIEHDLHHGGEISLILGMHELKALDL